MKQHCCDPRRLEVLKAKGSANAIEFIEVLDLASPPGAPRQETLLVRLLHPGFALSPDNLRITGGERIATVGVVWCAPADALPAAAEPGLVDTVDDLARTLVVRTDSSGDYSIYTLGIFANSGSALPPAGFDPRLSTIDFTFKVECPSDYDCAGTAPCPPTPRPTPEIDYLARDYQGFRRLMLDRLSLLVPGWQERSAADLGVTLVELLAYAADNLAYRQDAVANEAYLATARQRISVRRHARLVDYHLHEGCNARAFVHFEVNGHDIALDKGTQLLTRVPALDVVLTPGSLALSEAIDGGAEIFETVAPAVLDEQQNSLAFYAWGNNGCCLPRGTTRATLRGHIDTLAVGDFMIFEEVISPTTLSPDDADPGHRCAVRLTEVALTSDPSGGLFDEPPVDGPVDVTEIAWGEADALPFPLCLTVEDRPELAISVARGNIVLADHGRTLPPEQLGVMPRARLKQAAPAPGNCCTPVPDVTLPARFHPALSNSPLTQSFDLGALLAIAVSVDTAWWPASAFGLLSPRDATPAIADLTGQIAGITEHWLPRRDLIDSAGNAPHVVVEIDNHGRALLRFGDGLLGKRPAEDTAFTTTYRIGNGISGNVGADAIAHIVSTADGVFTSVRNPLPASGGTEPEDIEAARRDAPQAFRSQERAVTAADYAAAAERRADVQRAAATFRWTGSWHTVFVTPDRFGGGPVNASFAAQLRHHLERFRMAGYDLDVRPPRYVPLDVTLHVCVKPDYFRAEVAQAVRAVLSSTVLPDGTLGLFHPDNFSFGDSVYLSRIIAAAQGVEGVEAVQAEKFQRFISPLATSLDDEVIPIGSLEIAQLANNPSFRERGRLVINAGGGK
ncbi:putative baseplate assembly protein [Bradyrhizobium diazoefficiens]|nr:putative baseplate assembly protein [Bradyrhizobium diazoefficiens]MBR0846471.1 putative baseplate assembly protein [Bradyrhizobium diazoefficiens]